MKRVLTLSIAIIICLLSVNTLIAAPDFKVEVGLNGGYTDNLIQDSSARQDTYSISSLDLNIYPLSFTEINLKSEYTYYSQNFGLSNLLYGGGITIIPTNQHSPFALYISTNYSDRDYRDNNDTTINRNEFNSNDFNTVLSLGYKISQIWAIRTGMVYQLTGYNHEEVTDKKTLKLFAGTNLTLLKSNSFDFEIGYNTGNLEYINAWRTIMDTIIVPTGGIRREDAYSILRDGDLKSYYYSIRLSRQLYQKNGISLTYSHRSFMDKNEDAILYGYSSGIISPWGSEYEGDAILINAKSYMVPGLIIKAGFGYFDRAYYNTLEEELVEDPFLMETVPVLSTIYTQERNDEQRKYYISIQKPFLTKSGFKFEPSINLVYTKNTSSIKVYDYSDFSLSSGINIRF